MDKITIHFINLYERVKNNNKHLLNKQKIQKPSHSIISGCFFS